MTDRPSRWAPGICCRQPPPLIAYTRCHLTAPHRRSVLDALNSTAHAELPGLSCIDMLLLLLPLLLLQQTLARPAPQTEAASDKMSGPRGKMKALELQELPAAPISRRASSIAHAPHIAPATAPSAKRTAAAAFGSEAPVPAAQHTEEDVPPADAERADSVGLATADDGPASEEAQEEALPLGGGEAGPEKRSGGRLRRAVLSHSPQHHDTSLDDPSLEDASSAEPEEPVLLDDVVPLGSEQEEF